MNRRITPYLIWILASFFLWQVGQDIFLLIPQPSWKSIFTSVRIQIFIIYVLLAGLAWSAVGWIALARPLPRPDKLLAGLQTVARIPFWLRWVLAAGLAFLSPTLVFFSPLSGELTGYWLRLFIIFFIAFWVSILLKPNLSRSEWLPHYFSVVIASAAVFLSASFLTLVTAYPFSLDWSEGNRLWDYSVLFGASRYTLLPGQELRAFAATGRKVLWGLPFLNPNIGIWGVRLWVELIKIWPYLVFTGLLQFGRWKNQDGWRGSLLFALWGFLFLHQGPIYSTLLISASLVLLGVRRKNIVAASALVVLAGFFAFESRWHWSYAPGLWAGMLALLQVELPSFDRQKWPQLSRPIVLGLAGYLGGQILPSLVRIIINGRWSIGRVTYLINPGKTQTFDQALLWERLLPNDTFLPGVLLGLLWAVGPLFIVLFWLHRRGSWSINRLQQAAVVFLSLAFLVVGLTASVKIGGGGDLHNLDMFLVTALLLAATAWPHLMRRLQDPQQGLSQRLLLILLLVSPLFYTVYWSGPPLQLAPPEKISLSLSTIQKEVANALEHGEVLFMDQRQLLTFGHFPGVPLVVDYEKKKIIDKAMANDSAYFDLFYADLANQRFSLIITERISLASGSQSGPFANENDAWVQWVAGPLLYYYKPLITLRAVGIQLFVPRSQPLEQR
ncbi:MAG: hypothetical protein OEZ02_04175 [Anaerolineae bacterium]|nr:hypothetical protein [Anaerolineae bacterium]